MFFITNQRGRPGDKTTPKLPPKRTPHKELFIHLNPNTQHQVQHAYPKHTKKPARHTSLTYQEKATGPEL